MQRGRVKRHISEPLQPSHSIDSSPQPLHSLDSTPKQSAFVPAINQTDMSSPSQKTLQLSNLFDTSLIHEKYFEPFRKFIIPRIRIKQKQFIHHFDYLYRMYPNMSHWRTYFHRTLPIEQYISYWKRLLGQRDYKSNLIQTMQQTRGQVPPVTVDGFWEIDKDHEMLVVDEDLLQQWMEKQHVRIVSLEHKRLIRELIQKPRSNVDSQLPAEQQPVEEDGEEREQERTMKDNETLKQERIIVEGKVIATPVHRKHEVVQSKKQQAPRLDNLYALLSRYKLYLSVKAILGNAFAKQVELKWNQYEQRSDLHMITQQDTSTQQIKFHLANLIHTLLAETVLLGGVNSKKYKFNKKLCLVSIRQAFLNLDNQHFWQHLVDRFTPQQHVTAWWEHERQSMQQFVTFNHDATPSNMTRLSRKKDKSAEKQEQTMLGTQLVDYLYDYKKTVAITIVQVLKTFVVQECSLVEQKEEDISSFVPSTSLKQEETPKLARLKAHVAVSANVIEESPQDLAKRIRIFLGCDDTKPISKQDVEKFVKHEMDYLVAVKQYVAIIHLLLIHL